MKNSKNGFTLVEVLGIVALLAIVMAMAVPNIMGTSDKLKVDMYCDKIKFLEQGAESWGNDNYNEVFNTGDDGLVVTLDTLLKNNYLKNDAKEGEPRAILDPRDNSSLNNRVILVYVKNTRIYAEYIYIYEEYEAEICGLKQLR